MTTPLIGTEFTIDGYVRTLRFTTTAHRVVKKRLGQSIRAVISSLQDVDLDVICELAAAAFTEGKGPLNKKEVVTPERVAMWLDNEPKKTAPLALAILEAVTASFERMAEGEANADGASATSAATSATTTSQSQESLSVVPHSVAGQTSVG
jgi:hypothetical protein